MKIYFDGDSWTKGNDLDEEHRLSIRFSALVSKALGAEEYNISRSGKSNHRIVRNLLIDNDISQYDLAIIQMTFPNRTEYFDSRVKPGRTGDVLFTNNRSPNKNIQIGNWNSVSMTSTNKLQKNSKFWIKYYKEIYSETYGRTYEQIFATTIRDHCKVNNVKLLLLTNNYDINIDFDLQLQSPRYPQGEKLHPSEKGHRIIADDILRRVIDFSLVTS